MIDSGEAIQAIRPHPEILRHDHCVLLVLLLPVRGHTQCLLSHLDVGVHLAGDIRMLKWRA